MMRIACDMLDDLDPAWSELASVGLQLSDRELTQLLAMTSEQACRVLKEKRNRAS